MRPEASPDTLQFERDVFRVAPEEMFPYRRDAYVIGTGPSLAPEVLLWIPRNAWMGVLNKALIDVVSMGVPARLISAWFCATPEYWRNSTWWDKANELAVTHSIPRVFSWQLAAQGIECDYTFYTQPSFGDPEAPDDLVDGVLRSGGTIAPIVAQYVAQCKARRGIFAGVDMHGRGYCDGSVSIRAGKEGEWPEMDVAVRTLRACQRPPYNLKLATLTPTALSRYVEIEQL